MVGLKRFCGSCRKFLEVRKCHNQNLPEFSLRSSGISASQCGLDVVPERVFQDRCLEKDAAANSVYPAGLCGWQGRITHFSGVLTALASEHFRL